jgi:hypothetical protein
MWWQIIALKGGKDSRESNRISVDEVALIRNIVSHHLPVLIAQNSSRRRPGGPEFFLRTAREGERCGGTAEKRRQKFSSSDVACHVTLWLGSFMPLGSGLISAEPPVARRT